MDTMHAAAGLEADPNRRADELFEWMVESHDALIGIWPGGAIPWEDLRSELETSGLTDNDGNPATAEAARRTWVRARIAVARSRGAGIPAAVIPEPASCVPSPPVLTAGSGFDAAGGTAAHPLLFGSNAVAPPRHDEPSLVANGPSLPVMDADQIGLEAVLNCVDESYSRRSPLFHWMAEHHDRLLEAWTGRHVCWKDACDLFVLLGLTDCAGKPATIQTAKRTWWNVRKAVAQARAETPTFSDLNEQASLGVGEPHLR
jgi:hypothetical protein